jgi:hypothetical protein
MKQIEKDINEKLGPHATQMIILMVSTFGVCVLAALVIWATNHFVEPGRFFHPILQDDVRLNMKTMLTLFLLFVVCVLGSLSLIVYKTFLDDDGSWDFQIGFYPPVVCAIIIIFMMFYPNLYGCYPLSFWYIFLILLLLVGSGVLIWAFNGMFKPYVDASCPETGTSNENKLCVWFGNYGVYILFSSLVILLVFFEIFPWWAMSGKISHNSRIYKSTFLGMRSGITFNQKGQAFADPPLRIDGEWWRFWLWLILLLGSTTITLYKKYKK